jgi:hypothetical protein
MIVPHLRNDNAFQPEFVEGERNVMNDARIFLSVGRRYEGLIYRDKVLARTFWCPWEDFHPCMRLLATHAYDPCIPAVQYGAPTR